MLQATSISADKNGKVPLCASAEAGLTGSFKHYQVALWLLTRGGKETC